MRLSAALKRTPRNSVMLAPTGQITSQPAPTRGWNARDPLPAMKPADAVVLDNYFPDTADVTLRGGCVSHVTGLPSPAETLSVYGAASAEEMWAWAAGGIYNVSSGGAAGAAAVTGLTNSRWEAVNYSTSGNHFIEAVNGVDELLIYDGTTWQSVNGSSTPYAITGVDTTDLAFLFVFKKRLFFLENASLKFWFLAVDSVAGTATGFDLGPVFKSGGHLVAGGSWTRDGGDGMDDLAAFITSMGEVAIYSGTDPADATNWSLIGRYDIPPPIGRRCLIKTGADLAVITIDGVIPLGRILSLDRAETNKVALSDRIRKAFSSAASLYRNSFGWEAISYPGGSQVLFNVPVQEGVEQHQYVLNATTGAWCRYLGWNARTWAVFKEKLYFADNGGNIIRADEGNDDNGEPIVGSIQAAYAYHGGKGRQASYQMVKPIIVSGPSLKYGLGIAVDFDTDVQIGVIDTSGDDAAPVWDEATWDVSAWSTVTTLKDWRNTPAIGTCGSILFRTSTIGLPVSVTAFDLLLIAGGPL